MFKICDLSCDKDLSFRLKFASGQFCRGVDPISWTEPNTLARNNCPCDFCVDMGFSSTTLGALQHFFVSNNKNKLAQAIANRNWREVELLVQKSPRMARVLYRIESGVNANHDHTVALPLHHCLMKNPPHQIVAILIAAYPAGLFLCDSLHKRYPMHIACCFAPNNYAVIDTLLNALPDTAMVRDKNGRLPLHYAIENDASPSVIALLLEYHPWSAAQADDNGWYPLHLACLKSDDSNCHRPRSHYHRHHHGRREVLHKLVESWPPAVSKYVQGQRPFDIILALSLKKSAANNSSNGDDEDETALILELLAEDDDYRVEHDLYSCDSSPHTMLINTAVSAGRIQI
jgi:Ankyrin repeats (3 copies)